MNAVCLTCPNGLQQYNLDNLKNVISYTNQKKGSAHPKIINSFLSALGFDLISFSYLRSVHLYCMQSVPIWQP